MRTLYYNIIYMHYLKEEFFVSNNIYLFQYYLDSYFLKPRCSHVLMCYTIIELLSYS